MFLENQPWSSQGSRRAFARRPSPFEVQAQRSTNTGWLAETVAGPVPPRQVPATIQFAPGSSLCSQPRTSSPVSCFHPYPAGPRSLPLQTFQMHNAKPCPKGRPLGPVLETQERWVTSLGLFSSKRLLPTLSREGSAQLVLGLSPFLGPRATKASKTRKTRVSPH